MLQDIKYSFNNLRVEYKIIILVVSALMVWMFTGVFKSHETHENELSGKNTHSIFDYKKSTAIQKDVTVIVNGVLEASSIVELRAEAQGYVTAIQAKEGDVLEMGAPIITIDSKSTLEQYNSAKFAFDKAQIALAAEKALDKKGLSSSLNFKGAQANFANADAALKQAEISLKNTKLTMPFRGVVDKIYPKVGDLINAQTVATLSSVGAFKAKCYVPEGMIANIMPQGRAIVKMRDTELPGDITMISGIADEKTKTFEVEVTLAPNEYNLKTGQGIYVEIPIKSVLAHKVPLSALNLDDDGKIIVRYIENGIVNNAYVEFIDEEEDGIWVSNLPSEAVIITMGSYNVKQGAAVNIK